MNSFRNISIKHKLTMIIMLTAIIVLSLFSFSFVAIDIMTVRKAMTDKISTIAEIIGSNSNASLTFMDRESAEKILSTLVNEPHIVSACIYEKNGEVFSKFQRKDRGINVLPPPPEKNVSRFKENHLILFREIILNDELIGTVYLKSDLQGMYSHLRKYVGTVSIIMLISLVVAYFLSSKLQRVVSVPILHIVKTARSISQEKNYSIRAEKQSEDEIGALIDCFNEMLGQIQARDEELKQQRKQLEQQVSIRTRELCESNLDLEQTVTELEKAIQKTNEMAIHAELADAAKSDFLANMSHEIRTPMNGVIGFADMLLESDLSEDQTDYAKMIKRSGESLLSLINDILDFSKIEAGQLDFEEITFDPELLVYDVCDMIRTKIETKPIEILCKIGKSLPAKVKGDPLRFKQVLTNLMGNAPKFTKAGEIELLLDIEEEMEDRVKLHAMIRDTGIGIPKNKLASIFKPFRQADGSITRKYGGTGLGLSICKKISSLMGGDVWAESEVGKGSTFHFTAYLKKVEGKETTKFIPVSLASKKALVVDDNKTNLEILIYYLNMIGIRAFTLTNGEGVLPILQRAYKDGDPFDVCICDIQMPGMNGYEVAKEVRKWEDGNMDNNGTRSSAVLIALSSLMEREPKRCEEAGFDAFLSKPARRDKLFKVMERSLGLHASEWKNNKTEDPNILAQCSIPEDIKKPVRILLAEDNPVNQKLAKMMLTKAGYQVELANNGKEAVEKYTASPDSYDLVFMDIQMPEMDGIQATQKIRKAESSSSNNQLSHVPIIAMTAQAIKGDREECIEAGMDDYISKPIKKEIVLKNIQKYVANRHPRVCPGS
ncbi:MAG: response regulator [Deltaproteobacteria bacterium]|nr:response regulator [Deltaproteobacteria bacterium]